MKPTFREVIAAALLLVLAGVSCSAQSQTAGATYPAPPTAATVSLLSDNFSSLSSGWDTGDFGASSVEYAHGGLHIKTIKPGEFAWSNPNTAAYEHVHVEVTASNLGG